jgi:hypothetical protein
MRSAGSRISIIRFRPIAVIETTSHPVPMKTYQWLVCIGLALAAGPTFAGPAACARPEVSGARELHQFLSLRAVEVVRLAARSDNGLAALIAPSASFDLGAGDVGRPLGTGVDGAHALARTMKADTYRFLGWDYMDMPADPCSKRKIEVEFIDSQGKKVFRVEFTFEAGRVVSANGWERSFEAGRL